MDKLTDAERILAWKASWHPSFDGTAIMDPDFTFRSVNPQFCKLLGVTPADLIGQRFQDITPPEIRRLEEANSRLIIDGAIDFYLLPKKYHFSNGHQVNVVMLVTRAPESSEGVFQFFVSRIMLDEKGALLSAHREDPAESGTSFRTWMAMVGGFVIAYGKLLATVGTILGAILISLWEYI